MIPMKTLNYRFTNLQLNYDLSVFAPLEKILFLDIETTGFSPKYACVFLIGVCYYQNGCWNGIQWFAEKENEESRIIKAFFQFARGFNTLIHFNGNQFDLPFLKGRISCLQLPYSFDEFTGIDIYKRIFPYKHFLKLKSGRQKSLEEFLGLNREDKFSGGELISLYRDYTDDPLDQLLEPILLHNRDDLQGMLEIVPILSYWDLFNDSLSVHKVQANHYKDYHGKKKQELMIHLKLVQAVPVPLFTHASDVFFRCQDKEAILRVPVYTEELKYFYADYKNYYYLPHEDMAIHKSVASFVDKTHRIQATAATCYTRKLSSYLPQWDYVFEPFFKREYKSPLLFFELTEELKGNRAAFSLYASHLLSRLAEGDSRSEKDTASDCK